MKNFDELLENALTTNCDIIDAKLESFNTISTYLDNFYAVQGLNEIKDLYELVINTNPTEVIDKLERFIYKRDSRYIFD